MLENVHAVLANCTSMHIYNTFASKQVVKEVTVIHHRIKQVSEGSAASSTSAIVSEQESVRISRKTAL